MSKNASAGVPRHGHGNLCKLVRYQNGAMRKISIKQRRSRPGPIIDGVELNPTKGFSRSRVGNRAAIAGHKQKGSPRAMRKLISVLQTAKRSIKRFASALPADWMF